MAIHTFRTCTHPEKLFLYTVSISTNHSDDWFLD